MGSSGERCPIILFDGQTICYGASLSHATRFCQARISPSIDIEMNASHIFHSLCISSRTYATHLPAHQVNAETSVSAYDYPQAFRRSFMQSEPSETSIDVLSDNNPLTPTSSHHGRYPHELASPTLSQSGSHGGLHESGSEWSLSTSPSPSDYDAWLGPGDALRTLRSPSLDSQISNLVLADSGHPNVQHAQKTQQISSPFLKCPHG